MSKHLGLALVLAGVLLLLAMTVSAEESGMFSTAVKKFAEAIARAEGFFVDGSLPNQLHNPGDLSAGDFGDDTSYEKVGAERLIRFPSEAAGWNALYRKLANIAAGHSRVYPLSMSLAAMGLVYSGGDPNWARNVAAVLNVSTSATLGEILNVAQV